MTYDLDRLRRLVSIADVLAAAGVEAPHRGRRIPCPIHRGANESAFAVKGDHFRCFVCGAHGDVIDFAQSLHGLSWRDAVRHVGQLGGIGSDLPVLDPDVASLRVRAARRRRQAGLDRQAALTRCAVGYEALTRSADHAGAALATNPGDEDVWAYLDACYTRRDRLENAEMGLKDRQ